MCSKPLEGRSPIAPNTMLNVRRAHIASWVNVERWILEIMNSLWAVYYYFLLDLVSMHPF